jgi:hypothetical protein
MGRAICKRDIQIVAYRLWLQENCPVGTAHRDWQEAKALLCSLATCETGPPPTLERIDADNRRQRSNVVRLERHS